VTLIAAACPLSTVRGAVALRPLVSVARTVITDPSAALLGTVVVMVKAPVASVLTTSGPLSRPPMVTWALWLKPKPVTVTLWLLRAITGETVMPIGVPTVTGWTATMLLLMPVAFSV
jgi:hypothetical protein